MILFTSCSKSKHTLGELKGLSITGVETIRHQGFLCSRQLKAISGKAGVKALVTKKVGMTSTVNEDGTVSAVTLLSFEPNVITQVKSKETDGYVAVQVGTGKAKNISKPMLGHAKAAKIEPKIVREFRVDEISEEMKVGEQISNADSFDIGDVVHVVGTSKGKGWAGTIKRHNFHRGRKTHGGGSYRRPGSIGSMYPQHIFKGKKMAGQMGHERVTVRNLKIALIDKELNVIGVTGAVPGPRKGIVILEGSK